MADPSHNDYPFLTTSTVLIPLSLLTVLLNISPFIWHIRSRNICTSSIVAWVMILNTINLVNAMIWHNNDLKNWWRGYYLCDIEVRLMVGAGFGGLTGAVLCLGQSLARVLDIENQKSLDASRQWVKDAVLCWGLPIWFIVVYYAVQTIRYTITAGYGCGIPISNSWVTVALMFIWPVILAVITCYYAGTVIYRLRQYKSQVASLLQQSKTSKSRFRRLFILAVLMTIIVLSLSLTQLFYFLTTKELVPYSWHEVHEDWNYARLTSGDDLWVNYADRWCWVVLGYVTFLTLGLGDELRTQYSRVLRSIGLGWILQHRQVVGDKVDSLSSWVSSVGGRVKSLLHRNEKTETSDSSTTTDLCLSPTSYTSKATSFSKRSVEILPIAEPRQITNTTSAQPDREKSSFFARIPAIGKAFATTKRQRAKTSFARLENGPSSIAINIPSPSLGSMTDDLVLQMVGAKPLTRQNKGWPLLDDADGSFNKAYDA